MQHFEQNMSAAHKRQQASAMPTMPTLPFQRSPPPFEMRTPKLGFMPCFPVRHTEATGALSEQRQEFFGRPTQSGRRFHRPASSHHAIRRLVTSSTSPRRSKVSPPHFNTKATVESANATTTPLYDVMVIGAGPAGLSLAAALGEEGLSVCCVDATLKNPWPNHYGVWRDEFTRVGYEECASASYDTTVIHTGGQKSDEIKLPRSYIRVDREMLKARFIEQCEQKGVSLIERLVKSVTHESSQWSDIRLSPANQGNPEAADDKEMSDVRARMVFDCTGHAVAFTKMDETRQLNPRMWFQAAYGIEAEVKSYPFGKDEMVLMDFRDGHVTTSKDREESDRKPTFLYVFPGGDSQAFFEETSIILKEALNFEELKARLYNRLAHEGVEVTRVIEEEFSLIPMGGALPDFKQRVVAFGGAALLVHPATGYMVGRTVRLAQGLAKIVSSELRVVGEGGDVARVSKACWDEVWGLRTRRQRDFLIFGAELLESLNMVEMRAFFLAFFKLPEELWSRFLGYELDSPLWRIRFALMFFVVADNNIRIRLLKSMVDIGRWRMVRSVLPEWWTAHQD